jgi:hypothetical protein
MSDSMRCYMSRRANGTYILSHRQPVMCKVGTTERRDLYFVPGDAFCVRDLCSWQAEHIFGIKDLPLLHSQEVRISGTKSGVPVSAPKIDGQAYS